MNRHILFLLMVALMAAASCQHREAPQKEDYAGSWSGYSIHTTIAKQDTLGGETGICISNEALDYTLDTLAQRQLTESRFAIRDLAGDEPAVWVLKGQEFTHTPVQCGSSDGKRTLITSGLEGGESVVSNIIITSNSK